MADKNDDEITLDHEIHFEMMIGVLRSTLREVLHSAPNDWLTTVSTELLHRLYSRGYIRETEELASQHP